MKRVTQQGKKAWSLNESYVAHTALSPFLQVEFGADERGEVAAWANLQNTGRQVPAPPSHSPSLIRHAFLLSLDSKEHFIKTLNFPKNSIFGVIVC